LGISRFMPGNVVQVPGESLLAFFQTQDCSPVLLSAVAFMSGATQCWGSWEVNLIFLVSQQQFKSLFLLSSGSGCDEQKDPKSTGANTTLPDICQLGVGTLACSFSK
jgi:hypothetical protein